MADEDRDGSYVLEGLTPGRYAVAAGTPGRVAPPSLVLLADHVVKLDLDAPEGAQPGDLFVRAHGPGGVACQELQFSLTSSDDDGSSTWDSAVAQPEPDGRYWLKLGRDWRRDRAAASKGVNHSALRVTSREFGTQSVELRRGQEEADVFFQSPATVDLELTHYDSDSARARVTVIRIDSCDSEGSCESHSVPDDQPDASGHSSMMHLQPGRNVLGLSWTPRPDELVSFLQTTTVDLVSGPNHVTIDVPRFHELAVSWRGDAFGSPVDVTVQCPEKHD
jgi:hypothetical protein